ncbi:MAG: hypothetical protein V3U78_05395 [Thiotrichaceae bacterium]
MSRAKKILVDDVWKWDRGQFTVLSMVDDIIVGVVSKVGHRNVKLGAGMNLCFDDFNSYTLIERDGKPVEAEPTLEERVIAEYGDYDVVMLEWDDRSNWTIKNNGNLNAHVIAQSMKGWHKYVYYNSDTDRLYALRDTYNYKNNVTIMPIGALFEKATS